MVTVRRTHRSARPPDASVLSDASLALALRDARSTPAARRSVNSAATTLLTRHAGLIRNLASRIRSSAPHVELDDLFQIAQIAFLAACRSWDPESPSRSKLTTYATVCVKRAVLREVSRGRHRPMASTDVPLDDMSGATGGISGTGFADTTGMHGSHGPTSPTVLDSASAILPLLAHLTKRQRAAVTHAFGLAGSPATGGNFAALARRLGVTAARAKRLYDDAVERLRELVQERADLSSGER
jgi:RNA polymerase sigma factor (sigma-70 family)